ncbi:hypothetical protein PR202_ga03874 [Eleusine coracana subsp. coracana]|uniref:Uncharacterized protein n=1 Tax=Eleusine coracana subsp. coracana TaxID=191504 RepID=A0AAV5BNW3_ELECO|nr:hypothetical protein PR202_ga03874 [Eleusine coracana subsp. coracana]
MGCGGGVGRPPSVGALAAAAVAVWLVPVVLTLAVLWMPLLCCVVAAVRFNRARSRRRLRGCCDGKDGSGGLGRRWTEAVDAGYRKRLLDQYLEDQIKVVGVAEEGEEDPY